MGEAAGQRAEGGQEAVHGADRQAGGGAEGLGAAARGGGRLRGGTVHQRKFSAAPSTKAFLPPQDRAEARARERRRRHGMRQGRADLLDRFPPQAPEARDGRLRGQVPAEGRAKSRVTVITRGRTFTATYKSSRL